MSVVVTLVSSPDRPAVTSALVGRIRAALPGAGPALWLQQDIAADIALPQGRMDDRRSVEAAIREVIGNEPVDVIVQSPEHRHKRLLVADMDSTMIGQECIDELADFVGLKAHVSAITERAMRGEIAFEPALRERVALLKGLPVAVVDKVISERISLTPGGATLIRTMRANGAYTALVSGGFTLFTSRIAEAIGFDMNRGNVLDIEDGVFTGTVAEPILGREAKRETLLTLRGSRKLQAQETIAIGDGANDLAMLAEAGIGVAFRAKPAVAESADVRLDHADLTALLFAQGYASRDFVI